MSDGIMSKDVCALGPDYGPSLQAKNGSCRTVTSSQFSTSPIILAFHLMVSKVAKISLNLENRRQFGQNF